MPFGLFDPTMLLLIPAILFSLYAQYKIRHTFNQYSQVASAAGMNGAETAHRLLRNNGIGDVGIEVSEGALSDHYDPRAKMVRLSPDNYHAASIAGLAVAAHEVGHAIQDHTGYSMLRFRHALLPVANFGSTLAFPLLMAGFLLSFPALIDFGIVFFTGAVLFQLITLPVEFNASSRALTLLERGGYLRRDEMPAAKKVLNAAALTYVAAAAVSVLELVRLLILRGHSSSE